MDKYLYLRKIGYSLFEWFDYTIFAFEDGIHVISQESGKGKRLITTSELDNELENLWQSKYKSEVEV